MVANSEDDVRDVVEEMAKERGRTMNRKRSIKEAGATSWWTTGTRSVLLCGIIVVLFLTVLLLITGDKKADFPEEFQLINERLNKIEMSLQRLDGMAAEVRELAKTTEGLSESIGSLERDRRATLTRIDKIYNRLDDLSKAASASSISTSTPPTGAARHTVKKGETLFSIAQRYGLSVDEISRLNGLGKNSIIQPGQDLLVK